MLEYLMLLLGIIVLIKSADFLVDGSSSLAKKIGISSLIIGLTIVSFGTSMPELMVNVIASLTGNGNIAFGNIIGSNMANMLLILGFTALITQLKIQESTIFKEIPFSLLAAVVLLIFSNILILDKVSDNYLTRSDGLILILFFIIFFGYIISTALREKNKNKKEFEIKNLSNTKSIFYISLGIIGLYLGGQWTIDAAVTIATNFGISEFLIASTIIAIGTSLPELVTSVRAAMKKNVDLAVGNAVGSNIFNIFWILGISAIIKPIPIPEFVTIDIIILVFSTILLFLFIFLGKKYHLTKLEGGIMLIVYLIYLIFIILRG